MTTRQAYYPASVAKYTSGHRMCSQPAMPYMYIDCNSGISGSRQSITSSLVKLSIELYDLASYRMVLTHVPPKAKHPTSLEAR